MRIIALVIAFYFASNIYLIAQNKSSLSLEKQADNEYKAARYKSAECIYKVLDSITPSNPFYQYRLGVCCLQNSHKKRALDYLLTAAKNKDKCPADLNYYLGRAYHYNYKFSEAWESFNQYKNYLVSSHLDNNSKIKDIDRKMELCKMAKEIVAKPVNVKITSVGNFVNSVNAEYTPIITADEQKMYFTARKSTNVGGGKDEYDEDYYEDIYVSEKSSIGWGVPQLLGDHINTDNHDAVVSITDDGERLIIYKHVHNELSDSYSGDLFYSDLKGNQWSDPEPFGHTINTTFWEPSAHLSSDEKLLFFSSNKPGGFGGTDIYVSTKLENGKWGKAVNLGPKINTQYDDDAPYIMPDGKTLYFSSMGHSNIGGHDIFVSKKDTTGNWSAPQNLGYPINTPDDDLYFSWSADGTRIYFSSIREDLGATSSDIYVGEVVKNSEHVVVFKGVTFNNGSKTPTTAKIITTDLYSGELVSEHHSNSATGKFVVVLPEGKNYKVTIEKNGFLFQSFNLNVPENKSYIELEKNIYLDSLSAGKETFLRNVFFDNGSNILKEESNEELDKVFEMLESNPTMSVEIIGNIDDMIDAEHNKFLSESRAAAIQEYLLKKGIHEARILAVGYTDEGANNKNIEERIEHFKPELHIVSNMNFNYNRDKLKTHATSTVKRHKHGEPIVGTYLHESIYFPENESTELHKFTSHKIDEVLNLLLKYPSLKIRIEAHYELNADVKHNQHLAIAREKIVYNELIRLGADPKRIALTSYPDKASGNLNVNHENALKNRRIKFKVLSF